MKLSESAAPRRRVHSYHLDTRFCEPPARRTVFVDLIQVAIADDDHDELEATAIEFSSERQHTIAASRSVEVRARAAGLSLLAHDQPGKGARQYPNGAEDLRIGQQQLVEGSY